MQDAEDSLGGGPGSFPIECYIAGKVYDAKHKTNTAKYVPSNLNELEIEAIIAKRQYENQQKGSRTNSK